MSNSITLSPKHGTEQSVEKHFNVEFTTMTGHKVWNSAYGTSADSVHERMVRLIASAHAGKPISAEFGQYRSVRVTS